MKEDKDGLGLGEALQLTEGEIHASPQRGTKGSAPAAGQGEQRRVGRKRDLLFEALAAAVDADLAELTDDERSRLNKACAQLRKVSATPRQVGERAEAWKAIYPHSLLTPQSLTSAWSTLGSKHREGYGRPKTVSTTTPDTVPDEVYAANRRVIAEMLRDFTGRKWSNGRIPGPDDAAGRHHRDRNPQRSEGA